MSCRGFSCEIFNVLVINAWYECRVDCLKLGLKRVQEPAAPACAYFVSGFNVPYLA
jgi:hypothetical protein